MEGFLQWNSVGENILLAFLKSCNKTIDKTKAYCYNLTYNKNAYKIAA